MPGDCFALAVLVCCQNEFVGIFHQRFEIADLRFFIWVDDIKGLEIFFDIDALFSPGDFLIFLRDICCSLREVADMADRCLYNVVTPEKAAYFASFRGGFHDNEFDTHYLIVPCGEVLGQIKRI